MSSFPGVTMSGPGNSAITIVDQTAPYITGVPVFYGLGIICTVSNGASLTYTVQITADQMPSVNGNWNSHDVLQNLGTSYNGSMGYPVTALRLNISSYTSGTVHMGIARWP